MTKQYETVFIAKPQLTDLEVGEIVEKTKKLIVSGGGEILAEDKLGRRKLTHPINRNRDGFYVMLKFAGAPAVLEKLDHHFHVTDTILRSMTLKVEPKKEAAPVLPAAREVKKK